MNTAHIFPISSSDNLSLISYSQDFNILIPFRSPDLKTLKLLIFPNFKSLLISNRILNSFSFQDIKTSYLNDIEVIHLAKIQNLINFLTKISFQISLSRSEMRPKSHYNCKSKLNFLLLRLRTLA